MTPHNTWQKPVGIAMDDENRSIYATDSSDLRCKEVT